MRGEAERDYVEYVTARLPHLKRAAYLLCGDSARADDIVQATVTKLYVHWRRASAAENLDGYVHRMLVRQFLDERSLKRSVGTIETFSAIEGLDAHGRSATIRFTSAK